jgi:hypothetical protein
MQRGIRKTDVEGSIGESEIVRITDLDFCAFGVAQSTRCASNDSVGNVYSHHLGKSGDFVDPFTVSAADYQNSGGVISPQLGSQQLDASSKSNEATGRLPPLSRGNRGASVCH